jgi:putative lipoprotein
MDVQGRRKPPFLLVLAAALLLGACAAGRAPLSAEITGTVSGREPAVLLPDTELRVTLSETSRADAPAQFIAETTVPGVTKLPVAFRIRYDPQAIDPKLVYTLRARLEREGRLLFINDTQVRVLTGGAPSRVEMVVVPVSGRRD